MTSLWLRVGLIQLTSHGFRISGPDSCISVQLILASADPVHCGPVWFGSLRFVPSISLNCSGTVSCFNLQIQLANLPAFSHANISRYNTVECVFFGSLLDILLWIFKDRCQLLSEHSHSVVCSNQSHRCLPQMFPLVKKRWQRRICRTNKNTTEVSWKQSQHLNFWLGAEKLPAF